MSANLLRRDSAWWGWGRTGDRPALGPGARELLAGELGPLEPAARVGFEQVSLPEPAPVPARVIDAAGGPDATSVELEDRLRHAAGAGYPDLVRLRGGRLDGAPDVVLAPASAEAVSAILVACAREHVAVVPFGGGTSVVGGVEPESGPFDRLASLDLVALRGVEVDERSQTATLGAGLRGPEAERELNRRGYTLGHFPQSFCYATIGGFAATRSAGQASSGYGRFDSLVTSVRMTTPAGPLSTLGTPHTAAGPALRELIVGSEGALGVITDVTVRVRPLPARRRYEGWFAASFEEGIEIARELAQRDALPDVFRLSDREETRVSLAMAGLAGVRRAALERYLDLRGRRDGCMIIAGWEGEAESVARRRELSAALLRSGGAVPLGRSPGRSWEHGRYDGPYLRDGLMDAGALVETVETAHTYSGIRGLYEAVGAALRSAMGGQGRPGIVMCHVSHVYRDGASLYFTFICPARSGAELAQWRELKGAACKAIVAAGGTITHHHAVGRDHVPYVRDEVGDLGVEALRALKERLDPTGVMNPGKLLPG